MLGVVGSNLTIFKLEPTTSNMSQYGGQTYPPSRRQERLYQICDALRLLRTNSSKAAFEENITQSAKADYTPEVILITF